MKYQSENALRAWLRSYDTLHELIWIEAARGGTPGAPDVFLPSGRSYIPVELKHWRRAAKGAPKVLIEIRPAQARVHSMAHTRGRRTAVLFTDGDEVYLTPGTVAAMSKKWVALKVPYFHCVSDMDDILYLLGNDKFWRV